MEIKYPLKLELSNVTSSLADVTVVDAEGMCQTACQTAASRCYAKKVSFLRQFVFLQQLVADANNAATVQADYDRLGAKIDEMVEARVKSIVKNRGYRTDQTQIAVLTHKVGQLEGEAFVDQKTIKGLREAYDTEQKAHAELRRKVDHTHTYTIDQLMKDKESLLASVANCKDTIRQLMNHGETHAKERAIQGSVIKLMKHTIGEQRAHLRRLRAKLQVRARRMGELKQLADKFRNEGSILFTDNAGVQRRALKLPRVGVENDTFHWGPPTYRKPRRDPNGAPSVFGEIDHVSKDRNSDFYHDLKNLIVKNFVPRYPFPKKGK